MNRTFTRRSALTAGTLAALTTGLLGAAGTAEAAAPATVVYAEELAAESRRLMTEYQDAAAARETLADQVEGLLLPEGQALLRTYSDAGTDASTAEIDYFVSEIARHLPGLAPMIRVLLSHVMVTSYQQPGACCTPATGFGV